MARTVAPKVELMAKARKMFPTLFMTLNNAQLRALERCYSDTGHGIPAINFVQFANGVGKTVLLAYDMVGWTLGKEYVDWRQLPECVWKAWDSVSDLRDSGQLVLRVVCSSDDMERGGSLYRVIADFFPYAKITDLSERTYRTIEVAHPEHGGVLNTISVRTFTQNIQQHAGSTCNRIWINETLPSHLAGETLGRIRTPSGKMNGSIMMCATILSDGWDREIMDGDEQFNAVRSVAHLYENCIGEEVTHEMADEVYHKMGYRLERGVVGYKTGGVLSRASIENMINGWRKTCTYAEVEARTCGRPISGVGRIWPQFSYDVHCKDDSLLSCVRGGGTIIQSIDPHSARPTASCWAVLDVFGRLIFFDEWPDYTTYGPYPQLSSRLLTIDQEVDAWHEIERRNGINSDVVVRIGDPNKMRTPELSRSTARCPIGDLYRDSWSRYSSHGGGYTYLVNVDDSLDRGHSMVSSYLHHDSDRIGNNPLDISCASKIYFVASRCYNTVQAVSNYSMRVSRSGDKGVTARVDEKYSDFAGVVRYMVMYASGVSGVVSVRRKKSGGGNDWDKIRAGRIPRTYRKRASGVYY